MTIKDFESYLLDKYQVELEGLYTIDDIPIINNNYDTKIEEAYYQAKNKGSMNKINNEINLIYFIIKGCGDNFDMIKMPLVEYSF